MRKSLIGLVFSIGVLSTLNAQSTLQPIPLPIRESVAAPFLSPKGDELFFSIRNFPGNAGGVKDEADIFKVKWKEGAMPDAEFFTIDVFNSSDKDVLYGISADAKAFYVSKGALSSSQNQGTSLSVGGASSFAKQEPAFRLIRVNDKEEATEKEQIIEGWSTALPQEEFFVSTHQHVLIMVHQDKGGASDLYLSFRKDEETWEKPVLLPAGINSPAAEISPFLAADQRSLYFASNRENATEFKLYLSRRINEGWEDWSEPVQLDAALNDAPYNTHLRITPQDPSGVVLKARSERDRRYLFKVELDQPFLPLPVNRLDITLEAAKKIRRGRHYELQLLWSGMETLEGKAFIYPDQQNYAFFLRQEEAYTLRLLNHKGELILEKAIFPEEKNQSLVLEIPSIE